MMIDFKKPGGRDQEVVVGFDSFLCLSDTALLGDYRPLGFVGPDMRFRNESLKVREINHVKGGIGGPVLYLRGGALKGKRKNARIKLQANTRMRASVVRPHQRGVAGFRKAVNAIHPGTAPYTSSGSMSTNRASCLPGHRKRSRAMLSRSALGHFHKMLAVLVSEPLNEALAAGLVARHPEIDYAIPRIVEGVQSRSFHGALRKKRGEIIFAPAFGSEKDCETLRPLTWQ